jgi:hypothetical protein
MFSAEPGPKCPRHEATDNQFKKKKKKKNKGENDFIFSIMHQALPKFRSRFNSNAVKKKRNNQHRAVHRVK